MLHFCVFRTSSVFLSDPHPPHTQQVMRSTYFKDMRFFLLENSRHETGINLTAQNGLKVRFRDWLLHSSLDRIQPCAIFYTGTRWNDDTDLEMCCVYFILFIYFVFLTEGRKLPRFPLTRSMFVLPALCETLLASSDTWINDTCNSVLSTHQLEWSRSI